jgi:hypothetical protein
MGAMGPELPLGTTMGAPIAGVGMCDDMTGASGMCTTWGAAGDWAALGEYGAMPPREVAFFCGCRDSGPLASATVPANCALSSCEPHEMQ